MPLPTFFHFTRSAQSGLAPQRSSGPRANNENVMTHMAQRANKHTEIVEAEFLVACYPSCVETLTAAARMVECRQPIQCAPQPRGHSWERLHDARIRVFMGLGCQRLSHEMFGFSCRSETLPCFHDFDHAANLPTEHLASSKNQRNAAGPTSW